METNSNISNKHDVIYHGITKKSGLTLIKNKNILFVGKLNESKGYDIFVDVKKFKKINPNWKFISIGNEPRKKIFPEKNVVTEIGYISNSKVLKYYENLK